MSRSTVPQSTVVPSAQPSTKIATPRPTPIQDLATLAAQSDLIVRAHVEWIDGQTHTLRSSLKPEEWIKNPKGLIADNLWLWVLSGRDWGRNIPVAITGPILGGPDDGQPGPEYILFLHQAPSSEYSDAAFPNPNGLPSYYLTDEGRSKFSNAGVFSIKDGKIDYAGIAQYRGWSVDQFIAEVHRYAPTPVPVDNATHDLSLQGQHARFTVEVDMINRTPWKASIGPGARLLQQVKVRTWVKKVDRYGLGWDADILGLSLTQEEYDRMQAGSGRYLVFLTNLGEQGECPMGVPQDYFALQGGKGGIFEVKDGKIGYSGISGYEGYSLDKFKEALQWAVPTPIPYPTTESKYPPPTLADSIRRLDIIARVEIVSSGEASPTDPNSTTYTFKVLDWLKKPDWYSADTVRVSDAGYKACQLSLGKGPYIIFLEPGQDSPQYNPGHADYHLGSVYGIRDGIIEYGGRIGQSVDKVEADIRTAVAQPNK